MQGFSGFGSPVKQVKKSDKLNIKPKGSTATAKATKMMMGPKKPSYFGKTLSKFFGSKALGVLGLMGSAPLGASSTPKRKVVKSKKPNFKAINRDLQQAIYKGNKKRYK